MEVVKKQNGKFTLLLDGFCDADSDMAIDITQMIRKYFGQPAFFLKESTSDRKKSPNRDKSIEDTSALQSAVHRVFSAHDVFGDLYGPIIRTTFVKEHMYYNNENDAVKCQVWKTHIGAYTGIRERDSESKCTDEWSEWKHSDYDDQDLEIIAKQYSVSIEVLQLELKRNNIELYGIEL